ncbi:hypothetical protein RJ640_022147 [Escallonia rubra]|uniref:Uncharacterized protein n=1 Tax=Escallonia rubra TaxID=112253 RepID=A0AA88RCW2_9ASTE|nr:hypothetical protein RJ640_022147 [Escallonia rubra]
MSYSKKISPTSHSGRYEDSSSVTIKAYQLPAFGLITQYQNPIKIRPSKCTSYFHVNDANGSFGAAYRSQRMEHFPCNQVNRLSALRDKNVSLALRLLKRSRAPKLTRSLTPSIWFNVLTQSAMENLSLHCFIATALSFEAAAISNTAFAMALSTPIRPLLRTPSLEECGQPPVLNGHATTTAKHANTAQSGIATIASYYFANSPDDSAKAHTAAPAKHTNSLFAKPNIVTIPTVPKVTLPPLPATSLPTIPTSIPSIPAIPVTLPNIRFFSPPPSTTSR